MACPCRDVAELGLELDPPRCFNIKGGRKSEEAEVCEGGWNPGGLLRKGDWSVSEGSGEMGMKGNIPGDMGTFRPPEAEGGLETAHAEGPGLAPLLFFDYQWVGGGIAVASGPPGRQASLHPMRRGPS